MKQRRKKILVVCPYPEGVAPSQRLKFEQYYSHFRDAGFEVEVSPFISQGFWKIIYRPGGLLSKIYFTLAGYLRRIADLFRIRRYDIVYVHLWVTPFGVPVFEWLFRKMARTMIYDIDDLVYLADVKSKAHPLVTWIKGRRKPLYLMKHADHVITCTPYLDQFVQQYNQATTDISSTVNTDLYQPVMKTPGKRITIGWSGSLSTSKYFYLLEGVLKKLAARYQFDILVIGDPSVSIDGLNVTAVPWNEKGEVANLQRIDIGVYPLPEEEWVLGKSGLKAIQYMALGIPTVATAIGANFRVIEHGVSGFLVKNEAEWIHYLSQLMEDPALRRRIGEAAREKVEEMFSIRANAKRYLDILHDL
ncbi:MAG TPA: glycosyltransferase family 4 protein [Flavisolibacter sp.]